MAELVHSGYLYQKQPQPEVTMQQLWKVMDDMGALYDELAFDINSIIEASASYITTINTDGEGWIDVDATVPTEPVLSINSGRIISYDLMLMGG